MVLHPSLFIYAKHWSTVNMVNSPSPFRNRPRPSLRSTNGFGGSLSFVMAGNAGMPRAQGCPDLRQGANPVANPDLKTMQNGGYTTNLPRMLVTQNLRLGMVTQSKILRKYWDYTQNSWSMFYCQTAEASYREIMAQDEARNQAMSG